MMLMASTVFLVRYLEFVIQPISFVIAFILTMGFAVVVNKLLGRKIKTIDMLGALKSVE